MKVQEQLPIAHEAAAGHMAVAEYHVPSGMLCRIGSNQRQNLRPIRQIAIVAIHDFHLAEMNRLDAQIDIRRRLIKEPQLRLWPAYVRDRSVSPHSPPLPLGIDHVAIAEVPFL